MIIIHLKRGSVKKKNLSAMKKIARKNEKEGIEIGIVIEMMIEKFVIGMTGIEGKHIYIYLMRTGGKIRDIFVVGIMYFTAFSMIHLWCFVLFCFS